MSRTIWIALACVLAIGFLFRLNELGQPSIKDLDEGFHAIVARSMMSNPLKPMLYVEPFLPYDYQDWMANHVWLHKPPLALWQMAASMSFFGESNFTMRLPSLLLSTASVWLTFHIGRSLGNPRAGLAAAAFQSFNPAVTLLVHGQVFSDHVDTALLFYCELSVLMLLRAARSGLGKDAMLAGGVMGLAWLTKSFPATFVLGLAFMLWAFSRFTDPATRIGLSTRQFLLFTASSIVVCVPWVTWCLYSYPKEYLYEQVHVFRHLNEDIETFGNPWDRLLFDYLIRALLGWYPLIFVSMALLMFDVYRRREAGRAFVFFWALGVLVPHLLATSKTPSATLIGWPALWLAAGYCVSDAMRGRAVCVGVLVASGLLLLPGLPPFRSVEKEDYRFAAIMLSQWRILAHMGLIAAAAVFVFFLRDRLAGVSPAGLRILMSLALAWPVAQHVHLSYRTGDAAPENPVAFPRLGEQIRKQAPRNAVFFVENFARNEHIIAMWWLDRSCYPLRGPEFGEDISEVLARGGVPFILSRQARPEPVLMRVDGEATIYRLDQVVRPAGKP